MAAPTLKTWAPNLRLPLTLPKTTPLKVLMGKGRSAPNARGTAASTKSGYGK